MKKYLLLGFILFLVGFTAAAQNMEWGWARAVASPANESYNKIATDSRNGIYAFGTFDAPSLTVGSAVLTNQGSSDLLLTKYDSLGNVIWAKSFGSTGPDGASDIETDLSGNIIITGYFSNNMNMGPFVLTNTGGTDAFIAKISGNGNVIWAKSFTGNQDDAGYAITSDRQKNIYVAGRYNSTSFQFIDTFLTNVNPINGFYGKLDSNGNRIWARKIVGDIHVLGFSITDIEYYKNSERVLFCGHFLGGILNFTSNFISIGIPSLSGVQQMFKVVIDSSGGIITQDPLGYRTYAGGSFLDKNDNFYFCGATNQLSLINSRPFVSSSLGTNQGVLLNTQSSSGASDMLKLNEKLYILGLNNRNVSYNNGFTLQSSYGCSYIWETDSTALTTKYLLNTPFTSSGVSFKSLCADTAAGVLYSAGGGGGSAAGQLFSLSNNPNTQIIFGGASDAVISKIYVNRQLPFQLDNVENTNLSVCQNSQTAIGSPRGASGGTQPYTYSWSPATGLENPNAPYTFLANPPVNASYVLTATDAAGNTASTDTVHVNVLPAVPAPTVTASGPLALCPGQSVTLTSTPAYRYRWNTNNPGDTLQNLTVSTPQNYVVSAIDTNGCISPHSNVMNVTYSISQPTISVSGGSTTICQGDSVTLFSSLANGYLWSNGATGSNITVNQPGNYWVVATNSSGCSSTSDTVTITVDPLPPTPTVTASGPLSFCQGGSVQLTSSIANGYLWSNGATTQSITVTTAGNYSVVINNGGCSSSPSNPVTVTVGTATPVITAGGPLNFCQGGSVQLTSTAAGGYLWSNGATTQSITVSTAGNYSVVTNNGSCSSAPSNPFTVTVNPLPTTPSITANGPLTFCEGGSVQLSSTAAGGYLWSNSATTQNITVTTAGNYSVITTNSAGCSSAASNPVTVTVNPLPSTPIITANGPLSFCEGGSVQLSSTTAGGYLWSNGATTQYITVTTAGNYSVITTNSAGCSSAASNPVTVTVNPLPSTPVITANGPLTFCEGGSVQLSSTAAGGYLWSNGTTTQSIAVTSAGDYSVVTSNSAGCSSAASNILSVTVNQNPPVPVITQTGNTLSSSATTGNQWYFNGAIISGATNQTYDYVTPGQYSVTVTDVNGCSSSSLPHTGNFVNGTITILSNGEEFMHRIAPNPVNNQASINYQLQSAADISIQIIAINGSRTLPLLPAQRQPAGYYRMEISRQLAALRPGMYIVQYLINGQTVTEKFIVKR